MSPLKKYIYTYIYGIEDAFHFANSLYEYVQSNYLYLFEFLPICFLSPTYWLRVYEKF